jgi:hypothetical protein
VGGEEDGDAVAGFGAGLGPDGEEFFGEGVGEERMLGPSGYEVHVEAFGSGHDRSAIEAYAGAGVLRSEAEGFDVGDAVGAHPGDDIGDVRMPVAHGNVDRGSGEELLQETTLGECPFSEWRRLGAGSFGETDFGVAVLELLDYFVRESATAGDFAEVLGHLAEDIRSSVGEEEDGGLGFRHDRVFLNLSRVEASEQDLSG